MPTIHRPFNLIAGDDLQVNVRLLDQDGAPFHIDEIEVKWLLHNQRSQIVPHTAIITTVDAADGRVSIWLPAAETTRFPGGTYTDFLRVVCGGVVSTLLMGNIAVMADPWRAEIADDMRSASRVAERNVVVLLDHRERIQRRPAANDDAVVARSRDQRRMKSQ
jgi:hypothetical protein